MKFWNGGIAYALCLLRRRKEYKKYSDEDKAHERQIKNGERCLM